MTFKVHSLTSLSCAWVNEMTDACLSPACAQVDASGTVACSGLSKSRDVHWCVRAGSSFLSYILSSFPNDSTQGAKAFHEEEENATPSHQKIKPSDLLTKSIPELLEEVSACPYRASALCL